MFCVLVREEEMQKCTRRRRHMTTEANASTSQRMPGIASKHQELEKARGFPLQIAEGVWPCRHLDFRHLPFRSRRIHLFFWATQFEVLCYTGALGNQYTPPSHYFHILGPCVFHKCRSMCAHLHTHKHTHTHTQSISHGHWASLNPTAAPSGWYPLVIWTSTSWRGPSNVIPGWIHLSITS